MDSQLNLVKLECYDLIPDIVLGEEIQESEISRRNQIINDTNLFFDRLEHVFTTPKFYSTKVTWKDSCSEGKTRIKGLLIFRKFFRFKNSNICPGGDKFFKIINSYLSILFGTRTSNVPKSGEINFVFEKYSRLRF